MGPRPEDAMQIDLLPTLPTSGRYQTVMTAIDVFLRYLFAYPLIEATAPKVAKVIIVIMTKHIFADNPHQRQGVRIYLNDLSGNHCNFGHNTQMCNYKASANNWQTRKDNRLSKDQFQDGLRRISTPMAQKFATSCTQLQHYLSLQYWM